MKQRRWTLLVVGHDNSPTRNYSLTERRLRVLAASAMVALVAMAGAGAMVGQVGAIAGHAQQRALSDQLVALQARLDSLNDTLAVIGRRNEQIRLFAGLPDVDSALDLDAALPISTLAVTDPHEPASLLSRFSASASGDIDRLIERANRLAASFTTVSDALARNVERSARIPSIMPTAGWLSSNFSKSRFHPILHISRPHDGIDLSAPMGAPIVAPAAGVVTRVGRENGYGNVLEIDHGNGIVTKYAHCSHISVHVGQHVRRGDEIAAVGNTGLSTGPHLHYEIHVNGKVVDPLKYVLPEGAIRE